MKHTTIIILLLMHTAASGQRLATGPFEQSADTGSPSAPGSVRYDVTQQTLQLTVAANPGQSGGGHFAFRSIKGDFILTAETGAAGIPTGQSAGWLVRTSAETDRPEVMAYLDTEGNARLQWTTSTTSAPSSSQGRKPGYTIVQLERTGNTFIMRCAHPGEPLQETGTVTLATMKEEVIAGLTVNTTLTGGTVSFRNIRIDRPVADNYDPETSGYLGSRLELITIANGHRTIIHEASARFEAPNFMPDGKNLLINQDGSLFTVPVGGGTPKKFNTGSANRNNNDHVISFDGKWLGISSHREGLSGYGSTVYVLPISGGEPKLVTPESPSYLHSWSADNQAVLYVALRTGNSKYHIYRKRIDGGPETQLTFHTKGHVDGPEYSPDGKYIYYNGSQTGTMQLWRMAPDGTGNEQLTFDEQNKWFPHLSPDGKWIAFLSYPPTIHPDDHPTYKRVTLNLMPAGGGAPRVIAYLYGGQGTINVPSWSPDSSQLAFVSNSKTKD